MSFTLPQFLAHAIALEDEAAERYSELADMMEAHNNMDTAAVFRDMAKFSTLHGNDIRERSKGTSLPKLMSWQYRWKTPPEVGGDDNVSYLMTPYHALLYARENEIRGMEFYRQAASASPDAEVKRLGREFADEESEHVVALDKWIEKTPRPAADWAVETEEAQSVD